MPPHGCSATFTGTLVFVVVPSPSWPRLLLPQQYTRPPRVTPQPWYPPVLSRPNMSPPATATGTKLLLPVEPPPSCPYSLSPQQYAAPLVVRPQVLIALLALSAENVSPPSTATGTLLMYQPL